MKEIKISFGLNDFLTFLFDGIDKIIIIGAVIINKLVNEGLTYNLLFFLLDFFLFFQKLIFVNFTKIRPAV